eukprot:TRINITY_DN11433_c0_g1_i1.p1 TRINITY_DN11433_c0_g1~~TRINITY_DN11433_c0_g1_i1.p1  ORF type:complete len:414 (+),score=46.72 TRINITY_DN11433_c0_g1_i1:20-1261(+)
MKTTCLRMLPVRSILVLCWCLGFFHAACAGRISDPTDDADHGEGVVNAALAGVPWLPEIGHDAYSKWKAFHEHAAMKSWSPKDSSSIKVLVVVIVSDTAVTADRMERNIHSLAESSSDSFMWALFFYDKTDDNFKNRPWYSDRSLVYHEMHPGCKPTQYMIVNSEATDSFDYLWLMDEDIDLRFVGWDLYRRMLLLFNPLVSQPSVVSGIPGGRASDISEVNFKDFSNGVVLAREATRSEVMTPILDTRVWPAVLERIRNNRHDNVCFTDTFWDIMGLLGKIYCGRSGVVIMNSNPVVHNDLRTLPKTGKCKGTDDCWYNARPITAEEGRLAAEACEGIPTDWMDRHKCTDVRLPDCTKNLLEVANEVGTLELKPGNADSSIAMPGLAFGLLETNGNLSYPRRVNATGRFKLH